MATDKLDEIRQKLKLKDLNANDKSKLFKEFINSGGKVIDLNKSDNKPSAKRSKKSQTKKETSVRKKRLEEEKRLDKEYQLSKRKEVKNIEINPFSKSIERFSARLTCFFSGIFNFSAKKFKNKFVDLILNKYQNTLLESKMVLASVLYQNQNILEEIKKRLSIDQKMPYYFEIIYRYDNLYDEEIFNRISVARVDLREVEALKEFFLLIFKPLYVLKNYSLTLKNAIERALMYEKELRRLDSGMTFSNYRKINDNIDTIFLKVYPKLYILIDYYYKIDTRNKRMSFRDYINYNEEDSIGYLSAKWKEEKEFEAQKERVKDGLKGEAMKPGVVDEEAQSSPDNSVAFDKGLNLIKRHLNFKDVLNTYSEKKDLRSLFAINDKVFLIYALVDFFDKEFSFLFTSNKVKFNVILNYGNKIDLKKELSDNYYKINKVFESVNEYLKIIREIKKVDGDGYISLVEKSSRLNKTSVQRSQISRKLRKETATLFGKFTKSLIFVINDNEESKRILQNPDEVMEFNKKIDGIRLVDGQTILYSINEAYQVCSVIDFLLVESDLGGYSVVLDNPKYLTLDPDKAVE